jgi:hypothetical protein
MNDADGMKLLKGFHGRIKWIKYRCAMPGTKDLKKNSLVIDVCLK